MTVSAIIRKRSIREVVHFTTEKGRLGILDAHAVKSSARLGKDQRLEYIFTQNTRVRKDIDWLNYVNLSISRVNQTLLRISAESWHPDLNWCILAFEPDILNHAGVVFTTTNNIYTGVLRGPGSDGLEALFAPRVRQYLSRYSTRETDMPASWPTCGQAEVLYPEELSTEYLTTIYVRTEDDHDSTAAQIEAVRHPNVPIIVAPELFE